MVFKAVGTALMVQGGLAGFRLEAYEGQLVALLVLQ